MNDRFDSNGSFSGTFARPAAVPTTTPTSTPLAVATGGADLGNPLEVESTGKKGKKGSKKSSPKETIIKDDFEGNRLGISPMALGLIIGISLIGYSLFTAITESHRAAGQKSTEIREYKRMIRPMDLPGR